MYISMIVMESHSEEDSLKLSRALGQATLVNCCIALSGKLGAGKTNFVQGFADGLEVTDAVRSPTFSIVHEHVGRLELLHADLYRLKETDLLNLGLEEIFEEFEGVVIIEWAEKFPELIPVDHLRIQMDIVGDSRMWTISATGPMSVQILRAWNSGRDCE
jgi:tRNA threonylcarbamoyladenosine biosynthesis protein TsaE